MELYTGELGPTWLEIPSVGLFTFYGMRSSLHIASPNLTTNRYGNLKDLIQSYRGQGKRLNAGDYFVASGTSGEHIVKKERSTRIDGRRYSYCCLHEPDMGDQDSHAFHRPKCSRGVQKHVSRCKGDYAY